MDELIERVYGLAPAAEDSPLALTREYRAIKERQDRLLLQLTTVLGEPHSPLLQDYAAALRAEGELAARHFFQEGFRAGQELCQGSL